MKKHLAVSYDAPRGAHVTTTLCGREHSQNDGENNSTVHGDEVTCGHCLRILANPKAWQHRKYAAMAV